MTDALCIEVLRGPHVESRHLVDIVVVDAAGRAVESWGDPSVSVLPRSSLKPLQLASLVRSGAADAHAVTVRRLALACGSHGGEPAHVDEVTAWLADLGFGVEDLECGAHMPTHAPSARRLVREGGAADARHHNCSGKHCGFLLLCRHLGLDPVGYVEVDHPLQRDHITPEIEAWCAISLRNAAPGVDGCGIPVWPIPLVRLAGGWARLAADPVGRRLFDAMTAEPMMVAGTGRACTRLMQGAAGRVAVKTGAEGVYCAVDRKEGLAISLKARDGATRASETAIEWVLAHLGAVPAPEPRLFQNSAGDDVGVVRVVEI